MHKEKDYIVEDELPKTVKEKGISGSENDVYYYSDGSFTVDYGGMSGKVEYDEFGREI